MLAGVVFGQHYEIVIVLQSLLDDSVFLILRDRLDDFLDGIRAVFVAWNVDQLLSLDASQNSDSLTIIQLGNEVLAEKVTVVIWHEVRELVFDLFNNQVDQRLLGVLD